MNHPPAADPGGAPSTEPSSQWPATVPPLVAARADEAISRFDPLHDTVPGGTGDAGVSGSVPPRGALCRPALTLRVLGFVQASVLLAALPAASGWRDALLRAPVPAFAALAGTLPWLALVCAMTAWLARRPPLRAALLVVLAGALAGALGWGVTLLLGVVAAETWIALTAAGCGAALAAVVWSWLGLRVAGERPAEASARLAELQSRIRPHFLFNALNTALALVRVNPALAEGVLEDLSALFRAALAEAGSAVTLADEIDLARRYLAIEQLRFADRLELVWELDPAAGLARVPPLVLQPLVENAVRHGVEPAARGGRVVVRTRARRGQAEVEVINTLPAAADAPSGAGAGIALANVRERLRLLHDLAATLDTRRTDGLFRVRITVPL